MPARRRLLWVSLALSMVLLTIGLGASQRPVGNTNPPPMPAAPPASAPLVANITVPGPTNPGPHGPRPPAGPPVVRARLGQLVELAVTPPQPDAVSIPGFDSIRPGSPSTPSRFSLVGHRTGRFPMVLASSGQTVGLLEIGIAAPHRAGTSPARSAP